MEQKSETEAQKVKCLVLSKVIQLERDWELNFPKGPFRFHAVFQEHTHNCLGLSVPRRLQALGTGQVNRAGWAEPWPQCELAAWPNKDARAILGGRREEGVGRESVIGTPNFHLLCPRPTFHDWSLCSKQAVADMLRMEAWLWSIHPSRKKATAVILCLADPQSSLRTLSPHNFYHKIIYILPLILKKNISPISEADPNLIASCLLTIPFFYSEKPAANITGCVFSFHVLYKHPPPQIWLFLHDRSGTPRSL